MKSVRKVTNMDEDTAGSRPIRSSASGARMPPTAATKMLATSASATVMASRELSAVNARRIIARELSVGVLNGVTLALVMAGAVYAYYHNVRLSVTVALALVANIFVAAVGGILAPLTLERMGRDPAVSSSIFVTFLTDFMGFLAVLAIASLILL